MFFLINSSGGFPSSLNLVSDTFIDANGNFSFPANPQGYNVQATANKYFDSQLMCIFDYIYQQNHTLTIDPQTYLKIHAVNSSKKFGYIEIHAMIKGSFIELGGWNVDTTITGAIYNATSQSIDYGAIDSIGKQSLQFTKITPIRFDTTFVEINY